MNKDSFVQGLKARIKNNKTTRWVRFALVSIVFFAWVAWMHSWWLVIFYPLLFDIYITGYIPFTWWKKSPSKVVRTLMSWVDAIVYALILAYFVFAFVGQNYQIPSSSLEKTLLTGDYLWVNKLTYGPRVPMTPVHFPLVHNTLPILDIDSYMDNPSNEYRRLKGLRDVELGDIVVFNFPAGDTVARKFEESPIYYELLVREHGSEFIKQHPETFGEVIYRPVDRRTNFVKRCVALPGQTLKIVNDTIYLDGVAQPFPANAQFKYLAALRSPLTEEQMQQLDMAPEDAVHVPVSGEALTNVMSWLDKSTDNNYFYEIYLTPRAIETLQKDGQLVDYVKINTIQEQGQGLMFPAGAGDTWTTTNYGGDKGIKMPYRGMHICLNPRTWALYSRAIRNYEGHPEARLGDDGVVYFGDKPQRCYTFKMNYYFMMGDNRDNSQDSRFWGYVPEDHIVGTPLFVLVSFDKDRGGLDKVRWHRMFISANPDKQ